MEYLYWTNIDVQTFSTLLNKKNIQNSHKLYWLPAIIKTCALCEEILFDTLANEIIVDAWYTVCEYHVHLGSYKYDDKKQVNIPQDAIEVAVKWLFENTALHEKSNREEIIKELDDLEGDAAFAKKKQDIVRYAPYRLLAPFLKGYVKEEDYNKDKVICDVIKRVNENNLLPYVINWDKEKLKRSVFVPNEWVRFFKTNQVELLGWIDRVKIEYLQGRNPEMPGMVYKMRRGEESRNLKKVRALWDAVMLSGNEVEDIFSENLVSQDDYEVDHFIPWTYVANNELWNLCPIKSSINQDKSNNVPPVEYIDKFVENQKLLFNVLKQENDKVLKCKGYHSAILDAYTECKKDHLFAQWAAIDLYNFSGIFDGELLKKHIGQLRDLALLQGFTEWNG